jgi:hypothetical protein
MGRTYEVIDDRLAKWMEDQPVFFVSTAPLDPSGSINCSPKGNRREFVVLGDRTVAYLDQTGSGIETVAHLQENGRIVLMFCAFSGPPRIVRLHGTGKVIPRDAPGFAELGERFTGGGGTGVRSVIVIDVSRVSDSCGFGVPLMSFDRHRSTLNEWADRKGAAGIRAYWTEHNASSIEGIPGLSVVDEASGSGG